MKSFIVCILVTASLVLTASCTNNGEQVSGNVSLAPSGPAGLTATVQNSADIALSWQASQDMGTSGVGGYNVLRDGKRIGQTAASTTTYTDTGLAAGTTYTYNVQAFDNSGNVSALSNTATASTSADTTAPTVPQGVRATAQSASTISVQWSASADSGGSGLAGYRVFRDGSQVAQVAAGTITYLDSGLNPSTQYSYKVRAYDNAGNVSADSTAASATTQGLATGQSLGMTARPSNTSCVAPDRPGSGGATALSVVRALPNINFKPTASGSLITGAFMPHTDAASSRWYVTSLDGHIYVVNNSDSATSFSTFADISSRTRYSSGAETGLYGIAFHPNYPTNPRVYMTYSTTSPTGGVRGRVSEFRSLDGGNTLDPSTEVVLLTIDQPKGDHNGGFIGFSPNDGYLYVSLGDGGGVYDPNGTIGNGQDTTTLLGKVVRIDVDHPSGSLPFSIPADNLYAGNASCSATGDGSANCPEIYAYGLRNPWRGSFDRQSGQLWMSDNGEDSWEEVDRINLGGNYGWRCREGANSTGLACGTATGFIDPVAQYAHPTAGRSVIGGFVYHGTKYPALAGSYVFGDLYGNLFKIPSTASPTLTLTVADATSSGLTIVSLAEDNSGELYVVDLNGTLWRLQSSGGGVNTIPDSLLATGCISTTAPTQPASGLIPYSPNAPFWSDGADKRRWVGVPDSSQISTSTLANGDWEFPVGTVLVKDFSLHSALVETRLFMRHTDGTWAGYTYEWNDAQTDATRVVGGKDKTVGTQAWHFPSESECMQCHSAAAGYSLGAETGQLNGNYPYPSAPSPPFTGVTANQLDTLAHIGLLTPAVSSTASGVPLYSDPYGSAGTVAERARAYLHTNCSQCHRPGGGTPVNLDLRYQTSASMSATNTCGATPQQGNLGLSNPKIIDAANPANSVLYLRMSRRGTDQMPPIATNLVDVQGAALLQQWITQMSASCQ